MANSGWKKIVKEVAIVAAIGFVMAIGICRQCLDDPVIFAKAGVYSSVLWLVMWFGNGYLSHFIDQYVDWLKYPIRRLILGILGYTIFPLIAMFFITLFFSWLWRFNMDITSFPENLSYLVTAVIITFIIASFMSARGFFLAWRQLAVNEEKMKKEAITSKFESLKSQVNPHFLFNSLNALTSLIYDNQDEAARFVKQLSRVYRYVLDTREREVVPLKEELQFLDSYIFMQKTRHKEGLQVKIDIDPDMDRFVAPLSIQMLVENAIKHNEISEENPLEISIAHVDQHIQVTNNKQLRPSKEEQSALIGLSNIKSRYAFLTDLPVEIDESDQKFTVRIPLVEVAA